MNLDPFWRTVSSALPFSLCRWGTLWLQTSVITQLIHFALRQFREFFLWVVPHPPPSAVIPAVGADICCSVLIVLLPNFLIYFWNKTSSSQTPSSTPLSFKFFNNKVRT